MDTLGQNHIMQSSRQQKMFKRIVLWQQSNLKQKVWCQKHNMHYATFHYWYKRYRDQTVVMPQKKSADFIALTVNDPLPGSCWCALSFTNGKKLIFQQPVSAEFLNMLIA